MTNAIEYFIPCSIGLLAISTFNTLESQAGTKAGKILIIDTEKHMNVLSKKVKNALEKIKEEINKEYGFHETIPRINYGPCGVFAQIFLNKWNELFKDKVHICFVLTMEKDECDHILIKLPTGELYDGGIGIHTEEKYISEFLVEEMIEYDETLLEKWSYGLNRTYPRFCPHFDRKFVEKIINENLEQLSNNI